VTETHTRLLTDLRAADEPRFGGKSASLGELIAAEIPVPPGFAISTSAFGAFVAEAGLEDRIAESLAGARGSDVEGVQSAAAAIGEAIGAAPVPAAVREEVAARYAELAETAEAAGAGDGEPAVAVRSSAVGEDSGEATFAGQQETYLWVRGADAVCDALRDCWASTFSAPAIAYRARMDADRRPEMGVTVQLMVDAAVSGVMFTCNPTTGDPSIVAINASWGLGLGVVGGEVTPDEYLLNKVTGEVVRQTVGAKHVEYRADESGHGTTCVDVAPERQEQACLDEPALGALVDVARRVHRYFGGPQDVEWALAEGGDLPESLFVVQSRPVTATGAKPKDQGPKSGSALSMVMDAFGAKPDDDGT
jgi:pyruvate,water dikinase